MEPTESDGPASARPSRRQRKRQRTREEILDAAQAAVLARGVEAFTLTTVADELGLTKPALYYYFKSREAVLFELSGREWLAVAERVAAAVDAAEGPADAVEALIRTYFAHFAERLGLFGLCHQAPVQGRLDHLTPEHLERIRPVNDLLYAGVAQRALDAQARGDFPADRDPRRFAFTAHTSVIGLLTMRAMTAAANDPLVHGDDDLVNDLVDTFRRTAGAASRPV